MHHHDLPVADGRERLSAASGRRPAARGPRGCARRGRSSAASSASGRSSSQLSGSGGTHRSRLDSVVFVLTRSSTRSRIASGQQQRVEVGRAHLLPAGLLGDALQRAARVAAVVVVDLVVAAPQPLVGGDGHEQRAAGRDRAAQLAQRRRSSSRCSITSRLTARSKLASAKGISSTEPAITSPQLRARASSTLVSESSTPVTRAVAGELDHVAPAAAAGVEDARVRGQPEAGDHPLEHGAPPAVPPVAVLDLVRLQLVVPVHRPRIFSYRRPARACACPAGALSEPAADRGASTAARRPRRARRPARGRRRVDRERRLRCSARRATCGGPNRGARTRDVDPRAPGEPAPLTSGVRPAPVSRLAPQQPAPRPSGPGAKDREQRVASGRRDGARRCPSPSASTAAVAHDPAAFAGARPGEHHALGAQPHERRRGGRSVEPPGSLKRSSSRGGAEADAGRRDGRGGRSAPRLALRPRRRSRVRRR